MFGWVEDPGLGGEAVCPEELLPVTYVAVKFVSWKQYWMCPPTPHPLSTVIDVCGRTMCLVRVEDVAFPRAEVVDHAVVVVVVMCMK